MKNTEAEPGGPQVLYTHKPVAYTTGIGYVGPPDLKRATSKPAAPG